LSLPKEEGKRKLLLILLIVIKDRAAGGMQREKREGRMGMREEAAPRAPFPLQWWAVGGTATRGGVNDRCPGQSG